MSEFSHRALRGLALAATLALLAAGCSKAGQQSKTPLSQMAAGQADTTNPHTSMSPAARAALDSGNAAYRAGKYGDALTAYRTAADQAPLNVAPFFGIYMAAEKLGNKPLADSAATEIRKRSADNMSDSTLQSLHGDAAPAKKPSRN